MFADASKWRNLHRKPKLFFFQVTFGITWSWPKWGHLYSIQACRGNENLGTNFQAPIASDSAVPEIDGWPNFSDYMVRICQTYSEIHHIIFVPGCQFYHWRLCFIPLYNWWKFFYSPSLQWVTNSWTWEKYWRCDDNCQTKGKYSHCKISKNEEILTGCRAQAWLPGNYRR